MNKKTLIFLLLSFYSFSVLAQLVARIEWTDRSSKSYRCYMIGSETWMLFSGGPKIIFKNLISGLVLSVDPKRIPLEGSLIVSVENFLAASPQEKQEAQEIINQANAHL